MKEKLTIKKLDKLFLNNWQSYKNSMLLKNIDGWDSLKQINLIMLIEKNLGKKLNLKDILKIKKVGDVNKYFKWKQYC